MIQVGNVSVHLLVHVHAVDEGVLHAVVGIVVPVVGILLGGFAHRPAGEVEDALQLLAVEEVVEAPQVGLVRERVTLGDGPVRVHVAVHQPDDLVDSLPQLGAQTDAARADGLLVNLTRLQQKRVDVLLHLQNPGVLVLLGEVVAAQGGEVVVGVRVVQGEYEVD